MLDMQRFEREGFAITPSLLPTDEITKLITLIEARVAPAQKRGGIRDIMTRVPQLRAVADAPALRDIVSQILGAEAVVIRSTLFDKTDGANWKVPWHQDVTIAVRERVESEGFGPWSVKEGVLHVQPPSEVLEHMVTIRVHLDACPASNGALRVMPRTHQLGRINQNDAPEYAIEDEAICCEAAAGEALVMRPLLLHASSIATKPSHRRVLHFDYAATTLPNGLRFALV
jgi:ectoine hydroxylase-related dioxygenase (phytanoyl-CoA dioxygenase family)